MKVLHVLRRLDPGGIEVWLERLIKTWPSGDRPDFHFALETPDFGSLSSRFQSIGAKLHFVPPPRQLIRFRKGLTDVLKCFGPFRAIHVHTHYASSFALAIAKKAGVPVRAVHSHADYRFCAASWKNKAYSLAGRAMLQKLATVKLAVSKGAAQDLFGDDSSPIILPCGIEAAGLLSTGRHQDRSRFTLIHVGRLVAEKNHEFLIRLMLELRRAVPEAQLLLVGDGPLRTHLERLAATLGVAEAVHFLGARRDIPELLSLADLFVFPSLTEGLGLSPVEAQAAGLPVLLADHLPEEIDWLPGAVHRLALNLPQEVWVQAALSLRRYEPLPAPVRAEQLAKSHFCMSSNVNILRSIYAT